MKIFGSVCSKHPELKGERRACKSRWTGLLTPSHCLSCEKEKEQQHKSRRNELKRERHRLNPERERDKVRKWRSKNKERSRALTRRSVAKWRSENPDKARLVAETWRNNNPLAYLASLRKTRLKNAAKIKERMRAWSIKNRHIKNAHEMRRQANKLQATPAWANKFFMEEIYELARRRSALRTGGHAKWHVDHIVPLRSAAVCGLHVHDNLRVVPGTLNIAKGNRHWPDMPDNKRNTFSMSGWYEIGA